MSIVILIVALINHNSKQAEIDQLTKEVTKLRKYTRYQQKQIEDLREHNGNLYDENLGLKNTMVRSNIPSFDKDW
jgi:predicted  nucleic acid-binding Zn-ribbon protein